MDVIVCGLGSSVAALNGTADDYYTIGVNDIGSHFQTDHLVLLDRFDLFPAPRQVGISANTRAHVWYYWRAGWPDPWPCFPEKRKTLIHLAMMDQVSRVDIDADKEGTFLLPHYLSTPVSGISLAYRLGATRIGVIGMDLVDHPHLSTPATLVGLNQHLVRLLAAMGKKGVEVVNLSPASKVSAIPQAPLGSIRKRHESPPTERYLHLAQRESGGS